MRITAASQKRRHALLACALLLSCSSANRLRAQEDFKGERPVNRAGEKSKRPPTPPVNEAAAARAQRASRSRPASISDQVELAIKRGNAALNKLEVEDALPHSTLADDEKVRLRAQAASNYQRALKLNPQDWRAFYGLGSVYAYEQRYADAAAALERAAALRPNDPNLQIALGDAYASDSKHVNAIRAYARSIELDPSLKNEFAYSRLADAYERAEMIDEAIQTYRRVQAVKPAESFYWQIGLLYEKQKKYEEALDAYKSQIKLYPNDPNRGDVYEKSGHIYRMLGRFTEAIDSYKNQLRFSPKNISILTMLGETYLEINDIAAAREKQKELAMVEREQKYSDDYNSKSLMEHIDLVEQIRQLRQAIQANPRDADKHFRMGNAYFGWKGYVLGSWGGFSFDHYKEAIEQYKEAIRLEPDWDRAHYNLGLVYLFSKNRSAAIEQYGVLKQLKSDFAEELLKAINK